MHREFHAHQHTLIKRHSQQRETQNNYPNIGKVVFPNEGITNI